MTLLRHTGEGVTRRVQGRRPCHAQPPAAIRARDFRAYGSQPLPGVSPIPHPGCASFHADLRVSCPGVTRRCATASEAGAVAPEFQRYRAPLSLRINPATLGHEPAARDSGARTVLLSDRHAAIPLVDFAHEY
ncbi:hypothetical protein KM043_004163 [Ampulex compressa]|nr:hypothetical protein KM043_004163 [Ampulex compressa]